MAQLAVAEKVDSTADIDSSFSVDGDDAKAWWKPVVKELQAFGGNNDIANHSLFYIFIIGFVGGLLALVMPCIWPIIPMTVSFFLKRAKNDKKKGIRDAITYGLSIVIIYLALGLTVTASQVLVPSMRLVQVRYSTSFSSCFWQSSHSHSSDGSKSSCQIVGVML